MPYAENYMLPGFTALALEPIFGYKDEDEFLSCITLDDEDEMYDGTVTQDTVQESLLDLFREMVTRADLFIAVSARVPQEDGEHTVEDPAGPFWEVIANAWHTFEMVPSNVVKDFAAAYVNARRRYLLEDDPIVISSPLTNLIDAWVEVEDSLPETAGFNDLIDLIRLPRAVLYTASGHPAHVRDAVNAVRFLIAKVVELRRTNCIQWPPAYFSAREIAVMSDRPVRHLFMFVSYGNTRGQVLSKIPNRITPVLAIRGFLCHVALTFFTPVLGDWRLFPAPIGNLVCDSNRPGRRCLRRDWASITNGAGLVYATVEEFFKWAHESLADTVTQKKVAVGLLTPWFGLTFEGVRYLIDENDDGVHPEDLWSLFSSRTGFGLAVRNIGEHAPGVPKRELLIYDPSVSSRYISSLRGPHAMAVSRFLGNIISAFDAEFGSEVGGGWAGGSITDGTLEQLGLIEDADPDDSVTMASTWVLEVTLGNTAIGKDEQEMRAFGWERILSLSYGE